MDERISLSIFNIQDRFGDIGAIEFAHDIGLRYVDFDLCRYDAHKENSLYASDDLSAVAKHFREVRARADALGVKIAQTHGRIKAYNPDDRWNEGELKGFIRDALATEILGAPYCVVHGVHLGLDTSAEEHIRTNLRMFSDFLPHAAEHGICIASETLGDTHAPDGRNGLDYFAGEKEFLRMHYRICAENPRYKDYLCCCMDTGHTHKATRFGVAQPQDYIRMIGPMLRCLHLNDNDTWTDQHKFPLSGAINWDEVMTALEDIGYDGVYNMEISLGRYGKSESILRAHAIFAMEVMNEILESRE